MWKLLGDLAVIYCRAAEWATAARNEQVGEELVERAWKCLVQRKALVPSEVVALQDVIWEK